MAIRRSKRDSNFTIISNTGMKDDRLSFKAKGLLAYMLTLPDDWVFYESEIAKHSTDGKQAVRTGLKELQSAGYLVKEQARNQNGKFSKVDWVVSDEPENVDITTVPPSTTLPSTDKPSTVKPPTDNQPLLSTNGTKDLSKQNTNKPSSAKLTEDFEKLWQLYPKKQGSKKKALASYKKAIKSGTTNKEIQDGIVAYKKYLHREQWQKPANGDTWFNNERWNNEYEIKEEKNKVDEDWEEKLKKDGVVLEP